jgi:hypothetical protein
MNESIGTPPISELLQDATALAGVEAVKDALASVSGGSLVRRRTPGCVQPVKEVVQDVLALVGETGVRTALAGVISRATVAQDGLLVQGRGQTKVMQSID